MPETSTTRTGEPGSNCELGMRSILIYLTIVWIAAVSAFLVRTLADPEQGFREMLRVVRPGGRVICLEVSHPPGKALRTLFHFYFYKCAPFFGTYSSVRNLDAIPVSAPNSQEFPQCPQAEGDHGGVRLEQCALSSSCGGLGGYSYWNETVSQV